MRIGRGRLVTTLDPHRRRPEFESGDCLVALVGCKIEAATESDPLVRFGSYSDSQPSYGQDMKQVKRVDRTPEGESEAITKRSPRSSSAGPSSSRPKAS